MTIAAISGLDGRVDGHQVLRLQLEGFDGPLDLLLHLIQKHELNIFDVPIAFVTEEYLRYLDAMALLDLGVAGEYLVMAATLLHIKSAMLLPKPEVQDPDEDDEDPREALIRRLLEYQKFKDAARKLQQFPQLFRDTFPRPDVDALPRPPRTIDDIEPPTVFELIDVFQQLMKASRDVPVHEVTRHELSIKDAILSIASYLDATPRTTLRDLVTHLDHRDEAHGLVIAFMGVLEMAKLRLIRIFQARITADDLIVERAVMEISEIALRLDFSDSDTVERTESLAEDGTSAPMLLDSFDGDAVLEERLLSLRGRPKVPTVRAATNADDEDDAAMRAIAAIRADLDDYDVDAVLARAMTPQNARENDLQYPAAHDDDANKDEAHHDEAPEDGTPHARATEEQP